MNSEIVKPDSQLIPFFITYEITVFEMSLARFRGKINKE